MRNILYVSFIILFFLPFSGKGQFFVNANASITTPECSDSTTTYLLTANIPNQSGQIWNTKKINLTQRFDVQFQMFMGTKTYSVGADGMTFALQNIGITATGSPGGGLGFQGLTPSLAVEFDTYQNGWDPAYCHTAIEKNGDIDHTDLSGNNLAGPTKLSPINAALPDGAWHNVEIIWNPADDSLSVYFDCVFRIGYQGDIVDSIFGGNPNLYWGFTGGTGAAYNNQEVCIAKTFSYNLNDTGICYGDSAHLKVSGGVSYSWSPKKWLSADTGASVYAKPDSTITYTVSIKSSCGIISIDSTTITVNPLPKLTMGAPVNVLCNGGNSGSARVTASAGNTPYTYAWTPTGGSNAAASGLSAGTYTVTVTSNAGCDATASVTLTQPTRVTAATAVIPAKCGNNNGSAKVTPGGGYSPYAYLWAPGGQTTANAIGLSAAIYTVTVTDKNGCTSTATAIVPSSFISVAINPNTPVSCFGGSNGTATATVTGGIPSYTYSWSPTGGNGAKGTGLSAGSYTVTVTDSNGCTASARTMITQPALLKTSISAVTNVLCNGGNSGNATASATGGTGPYAYLWANIGGTNATGTGLSVGSYTITVTDNNGCTATTSVNITQPAPLSTTTAFTHASCNLANGTATVAVSGGTGPYAYLWNPSGQTTVTATGLKIGSYTASITDNNHCTTSASVTVTQPSLVTATIGSVINVSCNNGGNGSATVTPSGGTTPYTYIWNPGGNTNAHATGLFALSYTTTVTDANGCSVTAGIILTEPPPLAMTITEPKLICKDSMGILVANPSGGSAPYTYHWSTGYTSTTNTVTITPKTTSNYSVIVTDGNGCTETGQITLQYGPSFQVDISGKKAVCIGDSTYVCATAVGGVGSDSYLWEPLGNTNSCVELTPPASGGAATYTLSVVDGCGLTVTVTTTIASDPKPYVNMYANFYQGCSPLCIQFHNTTIISQGGIKQYIWDLGNGDTVHTINSEYCYAAAGEYNITLTAISDSGCSATLKKLNMITVYTHPNAAFIYSPQPVDILTPTVQFMDESHDNYGIAYHWWSFGDNSDSTSNLSDPTHTYNDTGTYCANLIVMNNRGCTDTTTSCFIVGPAFSLYIPSAFSPNGDSKNEVFKPVGKYIKKYEMYIFDRWGMEVFHSTDISNGWNGTMHGSSEISQEDIYIYKISVTDSRGEEHSYIGNVTLLK